MSPQQQPKVINEILNGNLIQLMLKLSVPGILAMLLIGLDAFFDAFFAGQLIGETALAGISLALPLTYIVTGCALLVGVGSASVLSRAIGSGDINTQSRILGNLILMSVIISFFITILGYQFGEELISFMGGDGEIAALGADYFKTYMLGSIFYILAVASSQLIKSEGNIRLATIFAGVFVIINIILNPIFISIFHLGIRGLALATVVAMAIYTTINFSYFLSGKSSIPVNYKKFTLAIDLLPAILSVGISELLMQTMSIVQEAVIFKSITRYGTDTDIALLGATLRVYFLVIIPVNGFVFALQPVIGMNYGAGNYDRLRKAYFTFGIGGTIFLTISWLFIQLSPATFLAWLLPNVALTANDIINFKLVHLLLPLLTFGFCSITLFQSIGNGKVAGLLILSRNILLSVPLVLIFSAYLGVKGVYYGFVLVDIFILLITFVLTWKEFKKFSLEEELRSQNSGVRIN